MMDSGIPSRAGCDEADRQYEAHEVAQELS